MLSAMHVYHDTRIPSTFGYMCSLPLCILFLSLICTGMLPMDVIFDH